MKTCRLDNKHSFQLLVTGTSEQTSIVKVLSERKVNYEFLVLVYVPVW